MTCKRQKVIATKRIHGKDVLFQRDFLYKSEIGDIEHIISAYNRYLLWFTVYVCVMLSQGNKILSNDTGLQKMFHFISNYTSGDFKITSVIGDE